jgi:2-haloacid dehalogenase
MNRREFFGTAAVAAAATASLASQARAAAASGLRAIAFDGFVIFDPRPVGALAEQLFPAKGAALMAAWRTRQFEYSWLRTLTGDYADFWQVTREALQFACAAQGIETGAEQTERLMQAHLALPPWPDVPPTLVALRDAGIRLDLLSNFTAPMQDANLAAAGLANYFEARLTTDAVRAYKPAPRAYQLGVDHFKLRREQILFAAFGGWDAAGAKRFGYPVFWCNRQGQPAEVLGARADHVAPTTEGLAALVRGAA